MINYLMYDQIGITKDSEASCTTSFGHPHAVQQGLIFGFIVWKLICISYFNLSPCGDISTTLALAPSTLLDPSKYIVHTLDKSGCPVFCNSSHSAVKSGRICHLMAFLFSYVMYRGEILIPHKETHPVASGLFNIFAIGASLTTMIGWTAK
jgi:hypothetical protein